MNTPFLEDFIKDKLDAELFYSTASENSSVPWKTMMEMLAFNVQMPLRDPTGAEMLELFFESDSQSLRGPNDLIHGLSGFAHAFGPQVFTLLPNAFSRFNHQLVAPGSHIRFNPYVFLLHVEQLCQGSVQEHFREEHEEECRSLFSQLFVQNHIDEGHEKWLSGLQEGYQGLGLLFLSNGFYSSTTNRKMAASLGNLRHESIDPAYHTVTMNAQDHYFSKMAYHVHACVNAMPSDPVPYPEDINATNVLHFLKGKENFADPVLDRVAQLLVHADAETLRFAGPENEEELIKLLEACKNPLTLVRFVNACSMPERQYVWQALENASLELKQRLLNGILLLEVRELVHNQNQEKFLFMDNFKHIKSLILNNHGQDVFETVFKQAYESSSNKNLAPDADSLRFIQLSLDVRPTQPTHTPQYAAPHRF